VHPFEDASSLEFWSQKNDCPLFVVGLHQKKRPNDLVFARMFDYQVLDMLEVGVEKAVSMHEFKVSGVSKTGYGGRTETETVV
jgi:ribosome production factor 2